ncbi:MAG: FHA domain-containing protein [Pseudomonadota bacterium]
MLVVSVRERGKEEHPFTFDKDTIVIGRLRVNDVILPKRNISKKHATLELTGGEVRLTDLNSTNGTYVNGKRIMEPVNVSPADKIFVGDYIIQIRQEASRSAINGKVAPLEVPSSEDEARSTMQDLDGSMLEAELGKLGLDPGDIAGPETQVIDPDQVPDMPPDDLELPGPAEELDDDLFLMETGTEGPEEAPEIFEESGDLDVEIEEASSEGVSEEEELFEIPLEDEPELEDEIEDEFEEPFLAEEEPTGTVDMPAVDVIREADEIDEFDATDLGPIADLLKHPELRDALFAPDGSVVARDRKGNVIDGALGFADSDALADFAERFAGFEGAELGVVSRRLPGVDGWLSLIFPPVASEGIVAVLRCGSHEPVPISSLAKAQALSRDQAKEFVRALTAGGTVLIAGPETDAMTALLAAGIGQLPGKPRYVAIGAGVPRLGGDGDRERVELDMDYAVEEPEAFMEALDLLQPRWIVAGPCSGRSLLALLAVSATAQVPLLVTVRLPDPTRLVDLLSFADRRENGVLGSQGIVRMLALTDPLILWVGDDGKVAGLFGTDVSKDTGEVEIQARD